MKSNIIIIILSLTAQIYSQWQPEVRLTNDPSFSWNSINNQRNICTHNNTIHIVWKDTRTGNDGIFYLKSTDEGITWGSEIRLTSIPSYPNYPSIVAYDSVITIVWCDGRDGNNEIYYKISTDNGISWGTDNRLTNNLYSSTFPCISVFENKIYVSWEDTRDGNSEIYFKYSTDNGTTWGPDTRLTNTTTISFFPSIISNSNYIYIAYNDHQDGNREVYYIRSTNNGLNWESTVRLTNNSAVSDIPNIYSTNSNLYVVWDDARDGNREIYFKFSQDNGLNWSSDTRLTFNPSESANPSVYASSSNLHLIWHDTRDGNYEIYYKQSTDGGLNWGSDFRLTNNSGNSSYAFLTTSNSVVHTTWRDSRDGNFEIYYKRNPTGNPVPPSAPQLISPLNNQTALLLSLNLVWLKRPTATNYRVQLALDSLFSNLIVNDSTITDSIKAVSGLQPLTNYWWRVNAKNIGGTSSYSQIWRFKTLGSPAHVNLLYPPDDTTNLPVNINFIWSKPGEQTFAKAISHRKDNPAKDNIELVNKYWFELVIDTISLANLQRDTLLTDTTKNLNGLTNLTNYWWRVKAKNEIGWGNFSAWYKFTTIVSAPIVPVLFSPLNNAIGLPLNINLQWNKPIYATNYRVQVATDSLFSNFIVNDSTLTDSIKAVSGLQPLTYYYWRVNAYNIGGVSNYSPVWRFRTIGSPYHITLLYPANNSVNIPVNVNFTWQKGTDQTFKINLIKTPQNSTDALFGPEAVNKYWFELVTDTISLANLQRDTLLTDTTKNLNGLTNLTNYWWRVKAKNEIGWGNFSAWFKFTTIISNPTVPLLFNPQNNSTNIPTITTLQWYKLQNATSYRLQVSKDSVFSQIVLNDSTLTDSSKTITGLDTLTKYYWRVNSKNIGGVSNWSSIWYFTTIPFPPSLPNLISPLNNSVVNTLTPVLNWDSISTATNYRIAISTDSNFASAVLDTSGIINSHYMVPADKLLNNNSYFWKVKAINAGGASNWSTVWRFNVNVIGINSISTTLPKEYKLYENYPNPFNPTTKIKFDLPKNGFTKLFIYDITGREISVLINSNLNAGTYEYQWNASNLSSGIYFYKLETNDFSDVRKMILIK